MPKWWIFSSDGGKNYTITNNKEIVPPNAAPLQQPPTAQSVQALRNSPGVKSVSILKRIFGTEDNNE